MIEARFDAAEPMRFTRSHRTQIRVGDTLWFLKHALVPEHQSLLALVLQVFHPTRRTGPQERFAHRCGPLRRPRQVGETLGAGGCVSRVENVGAQFTQEQTVRPIPEGEDGVDCADEGPHQTLINLGVQLHQERLQKRRQFLAHLLCSLRWLSLLGIIHSETSWLPPLSLNFDGRSGGLVLSSP